MNKISTTKILRDLLQDKKRTFTVIFAIILGVFSVAMLSTSKNLLNKNLKENYLRTNPASFTFVLDSFPDELRNDLYKNSDVESIEVRNSIMCRFVNGNSKYIPMPVIIVEDFKNLKLNTFKIDKGVFPITDSDFVIERTGQKLTNIEVGSSYQILFPGYGKYVMSLSGLVHDAALAPSWMEGMIFGYVKSSFFSQSFLKSLKQEVKFTVSKNKLDEKHIKIVVSKLKKTLEEKGYKIIRTEIPEPGVHIHEKQMNALMFLILLFGILTLLLSCFLIINMISTIMTKEIRQIGIMKAIGASTSTITFIYVSIVALISGISTLIATPLGVYAGKTFAGFNAKMLNFELFYTQVDHFILLFIVFTGFFLPLLISFLPILNSGKVSVNSALNDFRIGNAGNANFTNKLTQKLSFSRTLSFAIRNAFRRKGRLVLTLIVLVLGGAIFITAFNIRDSTKHTVTVNFDEQPQDLMFILDKPHKINDLKKILETIDGIKQIEYGNSGIATIVDSVGFESKSLDLKTGDASHSLFRPEMIEGNWITEDAGGIVLNQVAHKDFKSYKVGDYVKIKINGIVKEYRISGICRQLFTPSRIYMDNKLYNQTSRKPDLSRLLLIDVDSDQKVEVVSDLIENVLAKENISVSLLISKSEFKLRVIEHLAIIIAMLITMTLLAVIVGGLGIISTMGMNIFERRRELGILRAIGLSNTSLFKIVIYEGAVIGFISWVMAIIVSVPTSIYMGNSFFNIFFDSSISFRLSVLGSIIWLLVNILFCTIASYFPAKMASKLSVNEALAYE